MTHHPLSRNSLNRRGLTLVEIMVTMALVAILAFLGLSAIKPGVQKGKSRGLATAIYNEFEAARQLAIKSGHPVALGIPTESSPTACSMYRLEGWNVPYVQHSADYSSEYPNGGFAAALLTGAPGASTAVLTPPISAKFLNFDRTTLDAWLPAESMNDYIFCYLPDGSLITNNLPSVNGEYTLVVGTNPNFGGAAPSGVVATGADDPITILVSPSGGVKMVTGCPGGIGPGTGAFSLSTPETRTNPPAPGAAQQIVLSELNIAPNPTGVPGEGVCVPGQYVTLEAFAYSPQGIPLYANWNHDPGTATGTHGTFSHPNGEGSGAGELEGEADRMEYLSPAETQALTSAGVIRWTSGSPPPANTGVFRARWSWTVPINSQQLDEYQVTVNVQNAQGNATILNPPTAVRLNPAPKGKLLVERRDPDTGLWQLWRMNPDGSGARLISPPRVAETQVTINKAGNLIAFLQGPPGAVSVKVRFVDGSGETLIEPPGNYTSCSISPDGRWVSYHIETNVLGTGTLRTKEVATGFFFDVNQGWNGSGYLVKKGRTGWSQNGRFMLYGSEDIAGAPKIHAVDLTGPLSPPTPTVVVDGVIGNPDAVTGVSTNERLFAPTTFKSPDGREFMAISCSGRDAFLLIFEIPGGDYTVNLGSGGYTMAGGGQFVPNRPQLGGPGLAGSTDFDDDYPSFSQDGTFMAITRSGAEAKGVLQPADDTEDQNVSTFQWNPAINNFIGPPQPLGIPDVRRAIYLPEEPPPANP